MRDSQWEKALPELAGIQQTEPDYLDTRELVDHAIKEQERERRDAELASLRAKAAALYSERNWQAVIDIGERLAELAPDAPDRLIESARAELRAEERARTLDEIYQRAKRHLAARQWDQALHELANVQEIEPDYRDTRELIEQAREQQEISNLQQAYQYANWHLRAGEWDRALDELTRVQEIEPDYRDTRELIEYVRKQREISNLRAEADALHRAGNWPAVLDIGVLLAGLAPDAPDPDGLIESARTRLAAEQWLAETYLRARQHIEVGEWGQALHKLIDIQARQPGYPGDVGELIASARREITRAAGLSDQPACVAEIAAGAYVNAVAFAPDGVRVALACAEQAASIVDLTAGKNLRVRGPRRAMRADGRAVAFDPTGTRMAFATDRGAFIVERGKRMRGH
jgi:tetratricopeptide (TPR) repeat protein